MPADPPSPVGRSALEAVASPARLEVLSALGEGPATADQLAHRLGRSRQALYYHLTLLERAGLIGASRRGGRRTYRIAAEQLTLGARHGAAEELGPAPRAIGAMLRLTAREARAALTDPATRRAGRHRELVALRGKARLDRALLRRVNLLIDEIERVVRSSRTARRGRAPLYAVTVVLTPARRAAPHRAPERGS